jgi:hypothetical protein
VSFVTITLCVASQRVFGSGGGGGGGGGGHHLQKLLDTPSYMFSLQCVECSVWKLTLFLFVCYLTQTGGLWHHF